MGGVRKVLTLCKVPAGSVKPRITSGGQVMNYVSRLFIMQVTDRAGSTGSGNSNSEHEEFAPYGARSGG